MKALAFLAALLASTAAFAGATGRVIPDPYAGTACYKFWLEGDTEQYAINTLVGGAPAQTMVNMLNLAAASFNNPNPLIATIAEFDDIAAAFQPAIAPKCWCISGDGVSITLFTTPIAVGIHPKFGLGSTSP